MTSVGSVDPLSAGDAGPAGHDGSNTAPGSDAPADDSAHAELLMGFLTEFHAASRAPAEPVAPGPAPSADAKLPNRFAAFVPPDVEDELDHAASSEPLPVWPPPPSPDPVPPEPGGSPKGSVRRRFGRRG